MVQATGAPIAKYFAALDDPRIDRTKRHKLLDIVTIALCATICGADSWVDIELFGNCKEEWFKSFLELPNGIPSHDTFGDVFARLDPEQFQRCFMEWVQAVAQVTQGEVVAIDGKTVRRSHDRTLGKKAIHMVNVWASSHGLALGQTKVDEKSNEITAIPKLLQLLELAGCIITIDAMGCQREIAREIIEAQADYLLAVKENQGRLYDDVRDLFEGAEEYDFEGVPYDFARTLNKGHGRLETRQCWVITDPDCLDYLQNRQQWANLNAVVKVTAQRETATGTTVHSRYSEMVGNFAAHLTRDEMAYGAQERGLNWGSIRAPDELVDEGHLNDRGFWVEVPHPELDRSFKYPGPAGIYNDSPWRISRRAPLIGEHNEEIYCGELGLQRTELAYLAESGVV